MRKYRKERDAFLIEAMFCEFPTNGHEDCIARATDVHHIRGRSGRFLRDQKYWTALCRPHHDWIHSHMKEARKLGLVKF
jgi:hypothetical protein